MSNFMIGWAEVDITPSKKVSLVGQFAERISEYVEKPLTATSMAVTTDDEQLVLCSCDLVGISYSLVDEVRALMADESSHPTAIQAIGYKEIAAALRGEMPMEKAVYLTKKASRNLAKRQLTWFRRDTRVIWLPAEGESAASLAVRMRDAIEQRFGAAWMSAGL